MSILNKFFRFSSLTKEVTKSILAERGTLSEEFPSDYTKEEKENINAVKDKTMTSLARMVSLSRAVDYIVKSKIEGDVVECGVWKGGSMMLIARKLLQLNDLNRKLFLFDTYEGMSSPGEKDVSAVDGQKAGDLLANADRMVGDNVWCYSSLDEVTKNLQTTAYPDAKMFFIKGKVEDTLPHRSIGKIALLRLDTDWYESTKHELNTLYDFVVTGGVIVIDDYGHWSGSKKAVDEFIEKRQLKIFLNRIDYTGRLIIKP